MLQIRVADPKDYMKVREFYYSLTDAMEHAEFKPGWKKDVYPSQDFLLTSIRYGELYIGESDDGMAACMVVNHEYNDGYQQVKWLTEAEDGELLVIHALGVHPDVSGRGIAKKMVRHVMETARKNNLKAIRLDVLEGNVPAEAAYISVGFQYIDTLSMFYEDTGWTRYKLFEYVLPCRGLQP